MGFEIRGSERLLLYVAEVKASSRKSGASICRLIV